MRQSCRVSEATNGGHTMRASWRWQLVGGHESCAGWWGRAHDHCATRAGVTSFTGHPVISQRLSKPTGMIALPAVELVRAVLDMLTMR